MQGLSVPHCLQELESLFSNYKKFRRKLKQRGHMHHKTKVLLSTWSWTRHANAQNSLHYTRLFSTHKEWFLLEIHTNCLQLSWVRIKKKLNSKEVYLKGSVMPANQSTCLRGSTACIHKSEGFPQTNSIRACLLTLTALAHASKAQNLISLDRWRSFSAELYSLICVTVKRPKRKCQNATEKKLPLQLSLLSVWHKYVVHKRRTVE